MKPLKSALHHVAPPDVCSNTIFYIIYYTIPRIGNGYSWFLSYLNFDFGCLIYE